MLDTLKLAQSMERRGVRRDEAEAIAESLGEAMRDEIGGRFERVDSRFDRVDSRLDRVDERLNRVDQRLAVVDSDLRLLKWMVGLIIAGVASLVLRAFFSG